MGWSHLFVFCIPWASTTIKIMVDPILMIKTLRYAMGYINNSCFNGGWNPRVYRYKPFSTIKDGNKCVYPGSPSTILYGLFTNHHYL